MKMLNLLYLDTFRCELVRRRATMDELKSCHSEQHVQRLGMESRKKRCFFLFWVQERL